jgi:hypothetical protein
MPGQPFQERSATPPAVSMVPKPVAQLWQDDPSALIQTFSFSNGFQRRSSSLISKYFSVEFRMGTAMAMNKQSNKSSSVHKQTLFIIREWFGHR